MSLRPMVLLRKGAACLMLFGLQAAGAHGQSPSKASGLSWDTARIDGRTYVAIDSIRRAYGFTSMKRSGRSIILEKRLPGKKTGEVEMKLSVGSQECFMNEVKFVFTYPVIESGGKVMLSRMDLAKLIDPVIRPEYIPNAGAFSTVILDAGHGGMDPGATNPLGTEADYNLKVAKASADLLKSKGFRVVLTRDNDIFLSLQERVEKANAVRDRAVFISIHFNSGGRDARGIETFTLSPQGVAHYGRGVVAADFEERAGNRQDSANIALATALHGSALRRLGRNTFDRGIKRARFSVLSGVRHPAILFEGGFMSHPYEARLIANDAYRKAVSHSIVDAVLRYRAAMTKRAAPGGRG
jgi:N-acetylmuramoyl-L-alanine amidase